MCLYVSGEWCVVWLYVGGVAVGGGWCKCSWLLAGGVEGSVAEAGGVCVLWLWRSWSYVTGLSVNVRVVFQSLLIADF